MERREDKEIPSKQGKMENSNSEDYVCCVRGNNAAVEKDELFNALTNSWIYQYIAQVRGMEGKLPWTIPDTFAKY